MIKGWYGPYDREMRSRSSNAQRLIAYALVGLTYLAGVASSTDWLMTITKPLLMPVLIWHVTASMGVTRASMQGRFLIAALVFSWLGDLALMARGDVWFLLGLGFFFGAQVSYGRAFWADGIAGPLRARPALTLPWVVWWIALLVVLGPHLGSLFAPVAIYGVVLVGMAALATGVNWVTAAGAALFVVSDSLLALNRFADVDLPGHTFIVMLAYIAGQALIVVGVLRRLQPVMT